ncbi:MAG TPA: O-antigen ligase family protein, partial [Candidatus Hydrogenedentes bacterium]|nr:O-antigen ligase family protein [Candidatus Hydrogenedentota bacterium]
RDPFAGVVLFYVVWCFASVLWAVDPALTIRKLAIFTMLCLGVLGAAKRLRNDDVMVFVFVCMGVYVSIGLASEIVIGSFRPWIPGYRFSGTCHPNGQALDCAFLLLSALFLSMKGSKRKFTILVTFLALIGLFLTRSRTAAAAAILAPLLFWGLVTSRSNKIVAAVLVGVLVSGVFLFQNTLLPILEKGAVMGRTDEIATNIGSLTGRTDLWREAKDTYISRRPTLGYGYNSFWTGANIGRIEEVIDFMVGSGHSAYIDLWLGVGLIGLIAYLLMYFLAVVRALRFYWASRDLVYAFYGSVLLLSLLQGLLESSFLHPSVSTLVSMVIIIHLGFGDPPSRSAITATAPDAVGDPLQAAAGLSPNAVSSGGSV